MGYLINGAGQFAWYNNTIPQYITASAPSTLLNGLLAYYNCDETSGTLVATSIGIYDASITVGTVTRSTGKIGAKALSFDSADAMVWASGDLLTDQITDAFTISLWFTLDVAPGTTGYNNRLFDAGAGVIDIRIQTNDVMVFDYFDSSDNNWQGYVDPIGTSGTFRHVVCKSDGIGYPLKIYINNSDVGNNNGNVTNVIKNAWSHGCAIGNHTDIARGLVGDIDEVGIWDRALTTAEINELYNAGAGKTYPFS